MKIENVFKLKTFFNIEKLDRRDVFRTGSAFLFPCASRFHTDRHFAFRKLLEIWLAHYMHVTKRTMERNAVNTIYFYAITTWEIGARVKSIFYLKYIRSVF